MRQKTINKEMKSFCVQTKINLNSTTNAINFIFTYLVNKFTTNNLRCVCKCVRLYILT